MCCWQVATLLQSGAARGGSDKVMTRRTKWVVRGAVGVLAGGMAVGAWLALSRGNMMFSGFFYPEVNVADNFPRYLKEREAMVALARAEKLAPAADPGEDQHFKRLPFWHRHLTDDGEVYVIRRNDSLVVRFYLYRGILQGDSALYYMDPDTEPFQGERHQKLAPHWYWVSSTS